MSVIQSRYDDLHAAVELLGLDEDLICLCCCMDEDEIDDELDHDHAGDLIAGMTEERAEIVLAAYDAHVTSPHGLKGEVAAALAAIELETKRRADAELAAIAEIENEITRAQLAKYGRPDAARPVLRTPSHAPSTASAIC
jgi:hypothetical protein